MRKDSFYGVVVTIVLLPILAMILSLGCFDDSSSNNTTSDTTPPTVASTSPADSVGIVQIADGNTITVTFSEAMDPTTITTNGGTSSCSGSIQLSPKGSNFVVCKELNATVTTTDNIVFTIKTVTNFGPGNEYKLKVTTVVEDAAGNPMASEWVMSDGFEIL